MILLFILIALLDLTSCYQNNIGIGVILRDGDEIEEQIIDYVFRKTLSNAPQSIPFQVFKEKVWVEDAIHYHRAVCSVLDKGVGVILTPTAGAYFPVLSSFSNEYNISIVSPEMVEYPDDPATPDLMSKFAVGIRPSTTRAILDLLRDLRWQEVVYIYDDDYGSEKLQVMFRVGYTTLYLKIVGFAKVRTAQEANKVLRNIVSRGRHGYLHVILDTNPDLSREILQLHVHQTGVRDNKYHFLLTHPALLNFWTSLEFRALKITGFLASDSNVLNKKEEWTKLLGHRTAPKEQEITVSNFYYHDAALFLSKAVQELWHRSSGFPHKYDKIATPKDCFQDTPDGRVAQILKKINVADGLTGKIQFSDIKGSRENINLTIVQTSNTGYKEFGLWSDRGKIGGIRRISPRRNSHEGTLAQIQGKTLRITTIINPPYMMLRKEVNGSELFGNDRFEGYCKDIIDALCKSLQYECKVKLVDDGLYGKFDTVQEKWTGIIGEIIQAKADLAIADLAVTGPRQRVVDFIDPFETASLSVLMKNPDSVRVTKSAFFVFAAFSPDVWVCIAVSALLLTLLLHVTNHMTGPPDSIESSSVIWERKITLAMNTWFTVGSALLQGTGVYPRSIASRILSGTWWFCTMVFTCLFIASLSTQLRVNEPGETSPQLLQLKALSVESILLEALETGWPKVGVISLSYTESFIEKSTLPMFRKYVEFLRENPDVKVSSIEEGVKRVRESDGGYVLILASSISDYMTHQKPCDLLAIHEPTNFVAYGFAVSPLLEASLVSNISASLNKLTTGGLLGHLHRKWWIESSQCRGQSTQVDAHDHGTLHSFSGLICILSVGFLILLVAFGFQYSRKIQDKESRRQQLTFDDINLDNRLPTPPPDMLAQPPPVLDVPEIDETLNTRSGSESFKDFFERMRGDKDFKLGAD